MKILANQIEQDEFRKGTLKTGGYYVVEHPSE